MSEYKNIFFWLPEHVRTFLKLTNSRTLITRNREFYCVFVHIIAKTNTREDDTHMSRATCVRPGRFNRQLLMYTDGVFF